MHHQQDSSNQGASSIVMRHLFIAIVAIVMLAVLYVEFQSAQVVGAAAVLFALVHIVAVVVIMYGGRGILRSVIRRFHGQPEPQVHSHDNNVSHHRAYDLETEGRTISWAWFYDIFTRVLFFGSVQKMMTSTVRLANIQAGEQVLDIGCGTGTLAILAKQTVNQADIYGTDASTKMIERARQKAQQRQIDVNFQPGLAEKIQFPDDTFDVVMNSLMMHHLTTELREKALVEVYRVLKPGGRLLIVDFEPPKEGLLKSFLTLILGEMTSIDNTTVPPLVEAVGFTQVEMGATDTRIATYILGIKPHA